MGIQGLVGLFAIIAVLQVKNGAATALPCHELTSEPETRMDLSGVLEDQIHYPYDPVENPCGWQSAKHDHHQMPELRARDVLYPTALPILHPSLRPTAIPYPTLNHALNHVAYPSPNIATISHRSHALLPHPTPTYESPFHHDTSQSCIHAVLLN